VEAASLNGTGIFVSGLLAHGICVNDGLSDRKLLGCAVGFGGVLVVNLMAGQGMGSGFNWLGDGFIVAAALVLSAASIYGKRLSQVMDPMVMTGYQLALGGAALVMVGALAGGSLQGWRHASASLLVYVALLSAVAFSLWGHCSSTTAWARARYSTSSCRFSGPCCLQFSWAKRCWPGATRSR